MTAPARSQPVLDVVIPAGGEVRPDRVEAMGVRYKPLADVCGQPLAAWVIEALRAAPQVGRIALVSSRPVLERLGSLADLTGEDAGSGPANLMRGLDLLGGHGRVLVSGCDAPLIRPPMVERFIARCASDAAIHFSYVLAERFQATFPGVPNRGIRVREGVLYAGALHVVDAEAILGMRRVFEEAFSARKRPVRMVRMLGLGSLGRYACGTLSVPYLERRAGRILGVACRGVQVEDAEFAFDVDKPEHLAAARELVAERMTQDQVTLPSRRIGRGRARWVDPALYRKEGPEEP